jgi:LysM repeat protein
MKRAICCIALILLSSLSLFAQLPPEQAEKIERLTRDIDSLLAANADLQRKIGQLNEELARVREEQSKSANDLAVQGLREDLRKLAEKIQEVDRKRIDDKDVVVSELGKIEKVLKAGIGSASSRPPSRPVEAPAYTGKTFSYKVQPGDTLSGILDDLNRQFKEKGGKRISLQQVLDANPGLKPERMKVGEEIQLPHPGE